MQIQYGLHCGIHSGTPQYDPVWSVPVSHCPGYKDCLAYSYASALYAQKVQRLKNNMKMGGSEHHVMKTLYVMMY